MNIFDPENSTSDPVFPSICEIPFDKVNGLMMLMPWLMRFSVNKETIVNGLVFEFPNRWKLFLDTSYKPDTNTILYVFTFYTKGGGPTTRSFNTMGGVFWTCQATRSYMSILAQFQNVSSLIPIGPIDGIYTKWPRLCVEAELLFSPLYGVIRWYAHNRRDTSGEYILYFTDTIDALFKFDMYTATNNKKPGEMKLTLRFCAEDVIFHEDIFVLTPANFGQRRVYEAYMEWSQMQARKFYQIDNQQSVLTNVFSRLVATDSRDLDDVLMTLLDPNQDQLDQTSVSCPSETCAQSDPALPVDEEDEEEWHFPCWEE